MSFIVGLILGTCGGVLLMGILQVASHDDVKWLKETRRARKGMAEEWEIACDLIGQPRARADELRVMVDGGRLVR